MRQLLLKIYYWAKYYWPSERAWREATGYFTAGLGLILGLAIHSYHAEDSARQASHILNNAGPLGAALASFVLGSVGVFGHLFPPGLFIWGVALVLGYNHKIYIPRLLGAVVLLITICSYIELLYSLSGAPAPSYGWGGVIGNTFGKGLLSICGEEGAFVALIIFGLISLTLTSNLSIHDLLGPVHTWLNEVKETHFTKSKPKKPSSSTQKAQLASQQTSFQQAPVQPAPQHVQQTPPAPQVIEEQIEPSFEPDEAENSNYNFRSPTKSHGKPHPGLFSRTQNRKKSQKEDEETAKKLTEQLEHFQVSGQIKDITTGPVVTTYEFEPAAGTKISKIVSLEEDLARLLKAQSLRILAPIPGKNTVGFEIPGDPRLTIGFADLIEHKDFKKRTAALPIALGVDTFGKGVIADLVEMPHLLVAGATGSGKSVFMHSLIGSLICKHTSKELRLVMIDPKMIELTAYNGLPHMATPVITDSNEGAATLNALVEEMEQRYRLMQVISAKNIKSFNEIVHKESKSSYPQFQGTWDAMPYIVLIIDELADLMMVLGKAAEEPITRLAQKARAAGIHLVVATQRPSADVVTGLIKANFPTRVSFRVLSGTDSRTILDDSGAETLLGLGDMLYLSAKGTQRLHGALITDSEVKSMIAITRDKKAA